ncbi:MAG: type II secretion system major pseudopilin GspG [Candidatus Omnitrophica bacterium]|nr:type II secretion system major pseudopilin GspG [Candidatus Omnitrophota bacterium]
MDKKGFTLVEILLVVVIIGILAAMVIPNMAGRSEQARQAAAKADIEANLSTSLDLYEADNGKYPTTEQGLKALLVKPTTGPAADNWSGPYLKRKKIPTDPWGHDYVYAAPGSHNPTEYDLSSLGPDGVESADDVVNWMKDDKK